MKRYIQTYKNQIAITLLILCMFFGGAIPVFGLELAGITLTLYRITIPLIFAYAVCRMLKSKVWNTTAFFLIKVAYSVLLVWMIYGVVLTFFSSWVPLKNGMKEMMELAFCIVSSFCIVILCRQKQDVNNCIIVIRIAIMALILVGLIEMIFGWHLPTSRYADPEFIKYLDDLGVQRKFHYQATGIFYNENDFATVLGLFLPVFFPSKLLTKGKNIFCLIMLIFSLLIIVKVDTTIVFFSILIGIGVYFILARPPVCTVISILGIVAFLRYLGLRIFYLVVLNLYRVMPNNNTDTLKIYESLAQKSVGVVKEVAGQVSRAEAGSGSFLQRITTYTEYIKCTFKETFGLGFGPTGTAQYFDGYNTGIVMTDPHSLWVEVLSQYGIVFLCAYVVLLLVILVKLIKIFLKNRDELYARIIVSDIIFAFASFAPSSFLTLHAQWILIGMSLACIVLYELSDQAKYSRPSMRKASILQATRKDGVNRNISDDFERTK